MHLRALGDAANIQFEVEDQGPGLCSLSAEKLFAPCSSAKKGGSGIGLAISRQLANHLGASLELKQSSPAGCCFRLSLPVRDSEAKPASPKRLPHMTTP